MRFKNDVQPLLSPSGLLKFPYYKGRSCIKPSSVSSGKVSARRAVDTVCQLSRKIQLVGSSSTELEYNDSLGSLSESYLINVGTISGSFLGNGV